MNRDNLHEWINNPALLDQETLPLLQQIITEYPYFQTARLLHLLNLKNLNDYRFDIELRRMAAFSGDRSRLRQLLLQIHGSPAEPEPDRKMARTEPDPEPAESRIREERLKLLEEQIKSRLQEIERQQANLSHLLDEKQQLVSGPAANTAEDYDPQDKPGKLRALPKDDLLEEFIRERNAGSGQTAFFSPEESARRSIEENDGIISETLARLVAAQGKYDRAIKIYQQLMLINPQKSSYFAAQIEKLKKEL
jgi:tetratricopeptide (TPR) repeat protein